MSLLEEVQLSESGRVEATGADEKTREGERVRAFVLSFFAKNNSGTIKVKDVILGIPGFSAENAYAHLENLRKEGLLEGGNSSNSVRLRQYRLAGAVAQEAEPAVAPVEAINPKDVALEQLVAEMPDEGYEEKAFKTLIKQRAGVSNAGARDLMAKLVRDGVLIIDERGSYKKVSAKSSDEAPTPEVVPAPEVAEDLRESSVEKSADSELLEKIHEYGLAMERAKDSMIALIQSVPISEMPTDAQRKELRSHLGSFLSAVHEMERAGLSLEGQNLEERNYLQRILDGKEYIHSQVFFLNTVIIFNHSILQRYRILKGERPVPLDKGQLVRSRVAEEKKAAPPISAVTTTPEPLSPVSAPSEQSETEVTVEKESKADSLSDLIETKSGSVEGLEDIFDRTMEVRAHAAMVEEVLTAYELEKSAAEPGLDGLLVRRLAEEILLLSKAGVFTKDPGFDAFIREIETSLVASQGDAHVSGTKRSWIEIARTINSSMQKVAQEQYRQWQETHPDVMMNEERDRLYDLQYAAITWLEDFSRATGIKSETQQLLIDLLLKFKRGAEQRFAVWEKAKATKKIEPALVIPESAPPVELVPEAPAAPHPEKKLEPLRLRFSKGKFEITPDEAFNNESFKIFFAEFDTPRHPDSTYDKTVPEHEDRFESALEAYQLWREAVTIYTGDVREALKDELKIAPDAFSSSAIEKELMTRVTGDTQTVRRLIDTVHEFQHVTTVVNRKKRELFDHPSFAKRQEALIETDVRRQELKQKISAVQEAIKFIAQDQRVAGQAWAILDRDIADATIDRINGLFEGKNWREKITGLWYGKRAHEVRNRVARYKLKIPKKGSPEALTRKTSMTVEGAASRYLGLKKQERILEEKIKGLISEFEDIEKEYYRLKSNNEVADQAARVKAALGARYEILRQQIFADSLVFEQVEKLSSGRAGELIGGVTMTLDDIKLVERELDPAFSSFDIEQTLVDNAKVHFRNELEKNRPESGMFARLLDVFSGYGVSGSTVAKKALEAGITQAKKAGNPELAQGLLALLFEVQSRL